MSQFLRDITAFLAVDILANSKITRGQFLMLACFGLIAVMTFPQTLVDSY